MLESWESIDVSKSYQSGIIKRIPCYEGFYDLLIPIILAEQKKIKIQQVLLIGGGGGQELSKLQVVFPDWQYTVIDSSPSMLEMAKQQSQDDQGIFLVSDFLDTSLPGTYELITAFLVLHFIEDKMAFLSKVYQQLAEEGIFVLYSIQAVKNEDELVYWHEFMRFNQLSEEHWGKYQQSQGVSNFPISNQELEEGIRSTGFTRINKFYSVLNTEAWIIRK